MANDSQPLRFCILGAGNIGRVHAQALAHVPGTQLTVVGDCDSERCSDLARIYGAAWAANPEAAVARPDVDVVCICTPTRAHAEAAIAAAQAGKHLVIEKPLDVTVERGRAIVMAARAAGIKATAIFPYRFVAGSLRAKEAIAAGRLGRLILASANVNWYRTQAYYDGSWRGTWHWDGGGALMNQSIHSIDLLQWLVGPVRSVSGRVATLAHRMETEDTGAAVLELADGGLGLIQGSTACWPGEPAKVALYGDRGSIVLQEGRVVTWKLADAAPDEEAAMQGLEGTLGSGSANPMGPGYELHRRQLADMVAAIRADRPPAVDVAEGLAAIAIIRAIYESAEQGAPVVI